MPTFGVMSETLERDDGSMREEADFFSVASTMPLVAGMGLSMKSGFEWHFFRNNLLCPGMSLPGSRRSMHILLW